MKPKDDDDGGQARPSPMWMGLLKLLLFVVILIAWISWRGEFLGFKWSAVSKGAMTHEVASI
jgi:hypothetical protein